MIPTLSLYEDTFSDGVEVRLNGTTARMLFVVHGTIAVDGATRGDGETWHGIGDAAGVSAGATGATVWRWDFSSAQPALPLAGDGVQSRLKLSAPLETLPTGPLLLRGDSVAFPPGGCAFRHVHEGPGIRCLIEGGIRIDTHGRSTAYGPGGAWFESGPEPVFAQAAAERASRFIRVMILPAKLVGKSSIRYVDPADNDKPRSQSYKIFVDAPLP